MNFAPLAANDLTLRTFEQSDAPWFVGAVLESAETVGRFMPWAVKGYALQDALSWIDHCSQALARGEAYEVGIFQAGTGKLLGGCGLNQFNRAHNYCNLGYWVRQSAQRRGVATTAVKLLSSFAFQQLKLTRVEIVMAENNVASEAVARSAGALFERISRNRLLLPTGPIPGKMYSLVPQC